MSAPKDKRGRDGILPGLLKGMATTAKSVMRPTHTAEYPHAEPTLPPRSRGVIALLEENCTSCMLCARPFDALFWSPQFEYAEYDLRDLLHEKDRLGEWMATVPPPPALDESAADPAEVTAANRPERGR